MNRDGVLIIASNAGMSGSIAPVSQLLKFAALVAAAEREACAAIARQWDVDHPTSNYGGCIANAILARGQHDAT